MTPKKTRRKVAVQKSIFTRYLAITMGIVVLSFIMLGTVMMAFFSQYWKNEKRDLLTQERRFHCGDVQRLPLQDQRGHLPAANHGAENLYRRLFHQH